MEILVISAHPDDETLGCGGTLLAHRARNDALHWIIATAAHEPRWKRETIERRSREIDEVARAYGMKSARRLGFPAAALDTVEEVQLIDALRDAIAAVRPDIVYTVHPGDVHSDHRRVFFACAAVLKSFYMRELGVSRFLCFETLSSTDAAPPSPGPAFVPNVFRDTSAFMDEKLRIMEIYGSEMHGGFGPRTESAIRALGRVRGAAIGVEHAEAFSLVREIER